MKSCPTCQASYPNNFALCPRDGTALVEAGAWSEGTLVRGKYRILSKLGQGGMGSVYKAIHVAFDEMRALKVMSPELLSDELFVRRFKQEAIITRKLQHPNAVRVDDIDETEDGRPFIVMEYIEGQSLKKLIQEQGALPAGRACSIVKQVAAALDAAHRLGMVHRDIKPDNIVLIQAPQGEQAKVLDFGIAKLKESRAGDTAGMTLTGTGVVIGTPQYMSPEQAMGKRGDQLDGRSDLYSLGIVMYQMLSGELPFKADTTMEMLLCHMQRPPTPIGAIRPESQIPERIANLVMRLLEKKPESRPASASALIEEIELSQRDLTTPGATRVARPPVIADRPRARETAVPGRPASQAPPAAPAPHQSGTAPAAPPRATAVPVQAPARPLPAPPPTTSSRWPLWVSLVVLALGMGLGAWYFKSHRPTGAAEGPGTTSTPVKPEAAPSNAGSVAPSQAEQQPPTQGERSSATGAQEPGRTASPEGSRANNQSAAAAQRSPVKVPPSRPTTLTATPASPNVSESGPAPAPGKETAPARPAVDPQKVSAALKMGNFYFDRGEYDNSIREYENGLSLDPTNAALKSGLDRARKAKAAEERVLQ